MKIVEIKPEKLELSPELSRSGSAKQFEDRLRSSIEQVGLAEPIKVAPLPGGRHLVIDGTMRVAAIRAIREKDPDRFETVSAYVLDYDRRFELRYQTDIYQDLLPSQLAGLVEHLAATENVKKIDIARYIGVSPATLRNYTGLWRLMERGGSFAKIVELMDLGVIPSSNPYAWLRLTSEGLEKVLADEFAEREESSEEWFERVSEAARLGSILRVPIKFVEETTDGLAPEYYRGGEDVRSLKRDLGLRRGGVQPPLVPDADPGQASRHLKKVSRSSPDPVLRRAAKSLQEYLQ